VELVHGEIGYCAAECYTRLQDPPMVFRTSVHSNHSATCSVNPTQRCLLTDATPTCDVGVVRFVLHFWGSAGVSVTEGPTAEPTAAPTTTPTNVPTTAAPTATPTLYPTARPTASPTFPPVTIRDGLVNGELSSTSLVAPDNLFQGTIEHDDFRTSFCYHPPTALQPDLEDCQHNAGGRYVDLALYNALPDAAPFVYLEGPFYVHHRLTNPLLTAALEAHALQLDSVELCSTERCEQLSSNQTAVDDYSLYAWGIVPTWVGDRLHFQWNVTTVGRRLYAPLPSPFWVRRPPARRLARTLRPVVRRPLHGSVSVFNTSNHRYTCWLVMPNPMLRSMHTLLWFLDGDPKVLIEELPRTLNSSHWSIGVRSTSARCGGLHLHRHTILMDSHRPTTPQAPESTPNIVWGGVGIGVAVAVGAAVSWVWWHPRTPKVGRFKRRNQT